MRTIEVKRITSTPSWLVTVVWVRKLPMSGFERDGVLSRIVPRTVMEYRLHAGLDNDVALDCHGRTFPVHEISSKILAKIRDIASAVAAHTWRPQYRETPARAG